MSLRDLPATVLEVLGLAEDSPFPGASLSAVWETAAPAEPSRAISIPFSELRGPVEELNVRDGADAGKSLKAVVVENHVYIRRGDGREQLYDLDEDPGESLDQARNGSLARVLEACRASLDAVLSTLESSASR